MPRTRVLLADPNSEVLDALLDMLQPEFEVVDKVQSGYALLSKAKTMNPDLIVLEVGMGDMTGFEILRQLQATGCPAKCVFLSLHEGVDFVTTALKMGAAAYVFKSSATSDLPAALRRIAAQSVLARSPSPS